MTSAADTPHEGFVVRPVERWRHGHVTREDDCIAEEVPVAMVYNGATFAVMMATPHDLDDFALGFSLSESLIDDPSQLLQLDQHALLEGIELAMRVSEDAPGAHIGRERERLLPGRSGCGICGTRELEQAIRQHPPVGAGRTLTRDALERAQRELHARQPMNEATGAVHAAAWATRDGEIALVREDVGRHNALDKLIGAMRRAGIDPENGLALVTSRASYEMVTKATSAGITVLAAISAPTALAIELARSAGITLVGFTRPGSHNVYAHPDRLLPVAGQELS
ncbi:formate dehydrogenase accessory sulfurtransferase FdhD [Dyella humicola]|uniref:formate dehydrogenase accessory sulfurtransferase FdhD n=1 Tax=Dyella humicola TaxID=2992126 RepID=UPI0022574576|nr:formate dehydrogenase accessory sulfurtransferase FdhD [Dyella humicola]